MDNLTHGLLGLALGALRQPEAPAGSPLSATDKAVLTSQVRGAWPTAERVQVFPAWFSLTTWRYVAVLPSEYVAGSVSPGEPPREERRLPRPAPDALPASVRAVPTVHEALAWARFPVISSAPGARGRTVVRIGDLRYHLRGEPTLAFVLELAPDLSVAGARLERGGNARELFERWRAQPGGKP